MNTKNLMVSLVTIVLVMSIVSAVDFSGDLASVQDIKVDGISVFYDGEASVEAGSSVIVKVLFTAEQYDSDVTVEAEIEGDKVDAQASTTPFDVEAGQTYKKSLTLKVPYELKDELSDDLTLNIVIDGKEYKTEVENIVLRVQRPSYNADVKSISVSNTVQAGNELPIEIVLKNVGYNDLDDVYVTARITGLNLEKTAYMGDIVALECDEDDDNEFPWSDDTLGRTCDEDDEDTVMGRLDLVIPYSADAGVYTLEIEVVSDDSTQKTVKQIMVENEFVDPVVVSSASQTVGTNQEAKYSLLIVNPTDTLKVYRIVTESSGTLTTSADKSIIAIPAGGSEIVNVVAKSSTEGNYNFDVNVFSGEELVKKATMSANVTGTTVATTSPVVILTVVLAIIFIVLLIVLIVLIGKKPEKSSEEFGESYY